MNSCTAGKTNTYRSKATITASVHCGIDSTNYKDKFFKRYSLNWFYDDCRESCLRGWAAIYRIALQARLQNSFSFIHTVAVLQFQSKIHIVVELNQ